MKLKAIIPRQTVTVQRYRGIFLRRHERHALTANCRKVTFQRYHGMFPTIAQGSIGGNCRKSRFNDITEFFPRIPSRGIRPRSNNRTRNLVSTLANTLGIIFCKPSGCKGARYVIKKPIIPHWQWFENPREADTTQTVRHDMGLHNTDAAFHIFISDRCKKYVFYQAGPDSY